MDPAVSFLSEAGLAGVLAFVVVALLKGWIVPGAVYQKALTDADFWRDAFLKSATLAEKVVDQAEGA